MKQVHRGALVRRLVFASGTFGIVILAVIILCAVLPGVPPFNHYLISYVNKKTSSLLLCSVTIGAITVDLRKGLVAKNVVLSDWHDKRTPLRADRAAAQIDLPALLRGRLELRSVKIEGLRGELLNVRQGLFAGPLDIGRITARIPATSVGSKSMVRMISAERCTVSYVDSITHISTLEIIPRFRLDFIHADSMSFVMRAGAGHFSSPVWSGAVRSNDVQGAIGPASLLFSKAEVHGDSALLTLSGTIPFSMEKAWDLTANAEAFVAGFPCVYGNVPVVRPVGKLKALGKITGTIVHPLLDVDLIGYGLQAGHVAADSLLLQAHYSNDQLRGNVRVWSPKGCADATVLANVSGLFLSPAVGRYTVTSSVKNIDVGYVMSAPPHRRHQPVFLADAKFYAAGSGLRRLPDTMSAEIIEQAGHAAGSPLNAALRLSGNRWDLTAEMKPDFIMRGNGRYAAGGSIDGSLHIQADSIPQIASMLSIDSVRGSVTADAFITGTLGKPVVSATVSTGRCSYGRGPKYTIDTVSARCHYADLRLQWQALTVKRGASVMQSDGAVSWAERTGTANADCKFTLNYPVSGGLTLTTAGDLAFANGIATATIKTVQEGSGMPLLITAHIPVATNELSNGLAAVRDGAVVTVSGDSVPYGGLLNAFVPSVQSLGTFGLHAKLSKVNGEWGLSCSTHIVNNGLTVKREEIKAGRTVLDLNIAGPVARPAGSFIVSGDSFEYRGALITGYSGSGSIVNDILKLDSLHVSCRGGGGAELSAAVPVSRTNGLSFNKNGRISATFTAMPFNFVQPFMPEFVTITKGSISGRMSIEGADKGFPQGSGTILLRNGECYLYECDRPLGPMSADIDFKNDSMLLRQFQAAWGGGRIAGTGWAMLGEKGISTAHGDVKLKDVRVDGCYENLNLGIKSADITCTKDSLTTITVDALLADTRFTQDYSLIEMGKQIKRKAPQTLRPPNPLFNKVVMRIAVNLNSNLTFDSNLGKMLLDGTVTVGGRPDKPSISGQVQIVNGFVYYLDRKFIVTQGAIRQYDPRVVNPLLDITATSSVSWYPPQGGREDYDITLLIKGDLSIPVIALSAVPSLPQPQIISLLTFGTIQTGMGSDLGSRTGSLVGEQLAGLGTRKLARFLDVESVDINGNVFNPSSVGPQSADIYGSVSGPSTEGPQLSVTKQVSSRVAVTYTKGLSALSQQMVLVSYRLLSFLYLEGETDQQAQGGIDLKFRYSR